MKKVCWFLIVVLLLGCFAGCHQQPVEGAERSIENEDGTLSDWMKEEIESFYQAHGKSCKFDAPSNIRYYGTDNGYVLIFEITGHDSFGEVVVANKIFTAPQDFIIRVYKNGAFIKIEDAYDEGLISKAAIDRAWEIHQTYSPE